MARLARGIAASAALALAVGVSSAGAQSGSPSPWDGSNPFNCVLQQAGLGGKGPDPGADPYCIEFDKRYQNVSQGGVVEFLSREPERFGVAGDKCFYFQSDHWRGSLVQDQEATKTYEWDGHYFFDRATGDGGAWVTNFNFNGQTGDPRQLPGFPEEWKPYFGPGEGGFRTHNSVPVEDRCVELAERLGSDLYRNATRKRTRCVGRRGGVTSRRLGPVRLGSTEAQVRRSLGTPARVKRGFLRYCVAGGGRFLVGQREDRSGDFGVGSDERTVFVYTSARGFRYRRVGPGSRLRTVKRRFRRLRRVTRVGRTRIYAPRRGSRVLLGVRRKRVRWIALRSRGAVKRRSTVRTFVRRTR
jgi:hypothetical protein